MPAATLTIESLERVSDFYRLSDLLEAIWGARLLDGSALRALAHTGNYTAGAWADGRLIGGAAGFLCLPRSGQPLALHSHVTGVLPEARGLGAGFAIKQHQRAWAMERGIEMVTWTYDPLVRRNARFNLARLGAEAVSYHVNFYGAGMTDSFNAGDESDRVLVAWRLASERAVTAVTGNLPEPELENATSVLRVGDEGAPEAGPLDGDRLRIQVPEDIVALRRDDPTLARAWRLALREALGAALDQAYEATAMSRDGWYLLTREAKTKKGR